jgi:hypothetical protein
MRTSRASGQSKADDKQRQSMKVQQDTGQEQKAHEAGQTKETKEQGE